MPTVDYLSREQNEIERERYKILLSTLTELQPYIKDRAVLDFGASYGLSLCALLEIGASYVAGVEPDAQRVERGIRLIHEMGLADRAKLVATPDTSRLPFDDAAFEVVIANAVLEHIPQPRERYIREIWRLVKPGGCLIINETPNKYLPRDFHTTGLWFVPWAPREIARRYAIRRGKWDESKDWNSCGWRGLGYFELTKPLSPFDDESPKTRARHHLISRLGLSPQIFDPYPTFVLRKRSVNIPA